MRTAAALRHRPPEPPGSDGDEHRRFVETCLRHGVGQEPANAVWAELHPARPVGVLASRAAIAGLLGGVALVSAANAYWAQRLHEAGGSAPLLVAGLAWLALWFGLAVPLARRSGRRLEAGFAAVGAVYAALPLAAACDLALGGFGDHWAVRVPAELGAAGAAAFVVSRHRDPVLTMLPLTAAVGVLVLDADLSAFGVEDPPLAAGAVLAAAAALAAAVVIVLDRQERRPWALWPALLADAAALAAVAMIAGALEARAVVAGLAVVGVGGALASRGLLADRSLQLATGAGAIWIGAMVATAPFGSTATAATLTVAGTALAVGATLAVRRARGARSSSARP